ncbi:VSP [Giardia duodenalis]|uniref:VSP n=1 Tax=Giardia intestinalis (strain ATCC 50803 / WB clone C6) TaxID=184922 RepID=A8B728_GIAIC|nr:VSP [Giardia intestinalis]KAE8301798.1 VSP [Giardia intestinalis]|eukprot:XP_001709123.1 VSP [Giardia lamblia ATCC 50803]
MFCRLIVAGFVLQLAWAAPEAETCTEAGEGQAGKCLTSKCDVWINGKKYCSQCAKTDEYLVDGGCKAEAGASGCQLKARAADGTCTQCAQGYFLHKNGCYAIGGDVGRFICADAAAASRVSSTTPGVCEGCVVGYFKNPSAANNKDSCIACNDATGVGGKKGLEGCATCDPPSSDVAICKTCLEGFFGTNLGNAGSTCTACTDRDNCAKCDGGAGKCTKCKATANKPYLKKGETEDSNTCIDKSGCNDNSHFTDDADDPTNGKMCKKCSEGIADCKTCALKDNPEGTILITCSACIAGTNQPNADGTKCVLCDIQDCIKCNEENMCEECTGGKSLNPLKNMCMEGCPAGTRDVSGICTNCHNSCAECDGDSEASCTACYPGLVLSKSNTGATGTCIPECTGRYAENCEAGQCTAVVGGSKYCSKCKAGYVPVDGVCVSTTTRAVTGCTPNDNNDGTCKACTTTYFLQSGGCYQSAAYPGSNLCSNAQNGKCTNCANGQQPEASTGSCPACASGCKTCEVANKEACKTCLPGYYLAGAKCVKCDTNDPNDGSHIVGVPNCISCAPPTGNSGPVTCYVKTDGTNDGGNDNNAGGSTNKSGLSTGAIAGISVAVIVVVGGLVGFLCWWFICRGKA